MLPGRQQLLLAGIPTGIALIGLLWLKRRRFNQFHHHTDPGGSSVTPEERKHNIIEVIQNEVEKEVEQRNSFSTLDASVEETIAIDYLKIDEEKNFNKSELLEENIAQKYCSSSECGVENNCQEVEKVVENSSDIETDNSNNSANITENFCKIERNNLEDSKLLNTSAEEIFEIEIDSIESEVEVVTQKEVNNLKQEFSEEVVLEEVKEVVKEENIEEVRISSLGISEISSKVLEQSPQRVVDIQEVIAEVEEKKEQQQPQQQEKKITEQISSQEKEIEKPSIAEEISEEGASAVSNMKTAASNHLAEKLASLELDTMKIREENGETEQKGCTERDSANHSPSEVMLASPSISNFSDAHSEGSSDSGKGHSDVATSPSRTPAGGSSLAGDSVPSIYEFVLPQVIVGRLIGRRGTFLHEIRTSTQTNIYIKRHPDTDKLKICAIEGTQQDIDKALAKIRQKFPLRRFPQLTLEKVSFVTINPLPPLKLEDFHLQLVEGVNNDVILSSLITAAHFFLQQPSHPSYGSLGTLNQVMNQVYSTSEAPTLETPIKDAVCAAPTMGGWYRAQIVNLDEEAGNSSVRFLDYGGYLTLPSNSLRQIRGDLLALPFQAVECYLANVAPAEEGGWTEEARLFVHNATVGQILQAQIYDYAEDGTPLVYLYASFGSQVVLINEELVMRGYGVLTSTQEV